MLRNAVRDGAYTDQCRFTVTKNYSPTLSALRGGGMCQISRKKKRYVTFERPLVSPRVQRRRRADGSIHCHRLDAGTHQA